MTFGTQKGGRASLRVPKANPGLTDAAARSAMDQILSAASVKTSTGPIVSRIKAVLQQISLTDFDVK